MNDELLIEEGVAETRIALIEDGRLAELHIAPEGAAPAGALGDIWLGRVTRVAAGGLRRSGAATGGLSRRCRRDRCRGRGAHRPSGA
jgi:hypothetical protein